MSRSAPDAFDVIVPVLGRDHLHIADLFGTTLPKIKGITAIRGCMALDVLKYDSRVGRC